MGLAVTNDVMNHADCVIKHEVYPAENAFMFQRYPWYIKKKYIIDLVVACVFH